MDSRSVFLFLLSTVTAFLLLVLALSAGGVVLLLPPVLGYMFTAGIQRKKRMEALEKTLSEMSETLKEIKEALASEKNETQ